MLERDTIEQLAIEYMTAHGSFLPKQRLNQWIEELLSDQGLQNTPENYDKAVRQVEPIILNLGYHPVKNGYDIKPKEIIIKH